MSKHLETSGSAAAPLIPRSIREARQIAQPPQFSPAITDRFYRAISIYLSFVLARTAITPNQITYLWIALGLVSVLGLDSPQYPYRLGAALLFQLSYLFDYVDGEVARLQNRRSKKGFLLDLLGHGLIKMALFFALGFRFLHTSFAEPALVLSFLASIGIASGNALPCFAAFAGYGAAEPFQPATVQPARQSITKKGLTIVALLFESPGIYALVLLGVALDKTEYVLGFYGVLAPLWMVYHTAKY